jgi:hypothetical protein
MHLSSDHLPLLKKAGLVLVIVGLMDIGLMIYAIASRVSYSSSLNVFAVVAGAFLLRGNLRAGDGQTNPSLNLRANGVPQSPRHSAGVHYLWRGLCVTPLSPG